MKRAYLCVGCIIAVALLLTAALATSPSAAAEEEEVQPVSGSSGYDEYRTIFYFYGQGCPHCALIEPYIHQMAKKYPQVDLVELEIYYNSTNQALFGDFNTRYGIKNALVPAVFLADTSMIAEDDIKDDLEQTIQRVIESGYAISPPGRDGAPGGGDSTGTIGPSTDLTIAMVIGASLVDSINPCAISVMVFLLMFMTGLGDRRRVLYVGVAYTVTVFLVYLIAGLGILTFLQSSQLTRAVYYIAAVLSIGLGMVNIKDFFMMGRKERATLAIPESRKPLIKKYIERASVPAAMSLGVVVSLFELPCTGGVYLAILSLLSNSMTMAQGLPYLILYNAIFVLPLAVILGIFYKGASPEKVNTWRLEKRRVLRLALGIVMILIGAIMLYEAL